MGGPDTRRLSRFSKDRRSARLEPRRRPCQPGAVPPTHAPVAQLDRATASGAVGRRFESCRAYHPKPGSRTTGRIRGCRVVRFKRPLACTWGDILSPPTRLGGGGRISYSVRLQPCPPFNITPPLRGSLERAGAYLDRMDSNIAALFPEQRNANHSPLEGESARQGRSPQSSRWGAKTPPRECISAGTGSGAPTTRSAMVVYGSKEYTTLRFWSNQAFRRRMGVLEMVCETLSGPDRSLPPPTASAFACRLGFCDSPSRGE